MAGIFNQSFGGGLANGMALADKIQDRKDRSTLRELADLARGGLGNAEVANQLGAGLIGLGQVNAGINAQNVPYNREQQALQRQDLQTQRDFNNTLALGNQDIARQTLALRGDLANRPSLPSGYGWTDPKNPSAGVYKIPGIQEPTPKPLSEEGKIGFDTQNGFIDPNAPKKPDIEVIKLERAFQKDFDGQNGDFFKVRDAFQRIKQSAVDPSAAGDLALIFNYMKVLDPGSTVREGEFATAQNAGGVDARIQGLYNQIRSGQRLTPAQRSDFVGRAQKLYQGQEAQFNQSAANFRQRAIAAGLNPAHIIGEQGLVNLQQEIQPVGGDAGGNSGDDLETRLRKYD